jgi:hypothetical protein
MRREENGSLIRFIVDYEGDKESYDTTRKDLLPESIYDISIEAVSGSLIGKRLTYNITIKPECESEKSFRGSILIVQTGSLSA